MSEDPPAVVSSNTVEPYSWGAGCLGWSLVQAPGLSVIQETMPPGGEETRHRHQRPRQFFHVLRGALMLECDGVRHQLVAGGGIEIAPMLPHQVRNESDSDVDFLVISEPPSHGDREVVDR